MHRLRIAFLASNNGTAFRAVLNAIHVKQLHAEVALLVSNNATSPAFAYAQENGIPSIHIPTKNLEATADERLRDALIEHRSELVFLSGYLRKLGPLTLEAFDGKILNVHPGILPKYGGQGMYGRKVHQAVLDNREVSTGATIHLVDAEYDHGPTVATAFVQIEPSDDALSLERRVMEAEGALCIETIRRIADGELRLPL